MSAREWQPGDVGAIDARGDDARVMFTPGAWVAGSGVHLNPTLQPRPLVVIDPENREQVERLARGHHAAGHIATWEAMHENTRAGLVDEMQAALREFANPTPPRPDEPLGLGAVVEDADGNRWVRNESRDDCPWRCAVDLCWLPYSGISAVRILSAGVKS